MGRPWTPQEDTGVPLNHSTQHGTHLLICYLPSLDGRLRLRRAPARGGRPPPLHPGRGGGRRPRTGWPSSTAAGKRCAAPQRAGASTASVRAASGSMSRRPRPTRCVAWRRAAAGSASGAASPSRAWRGNRESWRGPWCRGSSAWCSPTRGSRGCCRRTSAASSTCSTSTSPGNPSKGWPFCRAGAERRDARWLGAEEEACGLRPPAPGGGRPGSAKRRARGAARPATRRAPHGSSSPASRGAAGEEAEGGFGRADHCPSVRSGARAPARPPPSSSFARREGAADLADQGGRGRRTGGGMESREGGSGGQSA